MNTLATQSTAKQSAWLEKHPKLGFSLIDHLWNRMDGAYPNRWRAAFANQQAIENWREAWAEAFEDEGIHPGEIKAAIAVCRKTYDWPPSLAEFLKICRPPINYELAYHEAAEQMRLRESGSDTWSSPALYWAAASIGLDLQHQPYATMKTRWHKAMDEAADKIKTGKLPNTVPARLVALPAPGCTKADHDAIRGRVAELREIIGGAAKKMAMP